MVYTQVCVSLKFVYWCVLLWLGFRCYGETSFWTEPGTGCHKTKHYVSEFFKILDRVARYNITF